MDIYSLENFGINAKQMISSTKFYGSVQLYNDKVYWTESRMNEKGRYSIMSANLDGSNKTEEIPCPYSAKSKINTFGGSCFTPTKNGIIFCDSETNNLYISKNQKINLIKKSDGYLYADFAYNSKNETILAVLEETKNKKMPQQKLASISIATGEIIWQKTGADFYHSPKVFNDKIAWLQWNLPHMPWDNAQIFEKENENLNCIYSGSGSFQPEYDEKGNLYFSADINGYFRICKKNNKKMGYEIISKEQMDFALPLWIYGMKTYGIKSNGDIIATAVKNAEWSIGCFQKNGNNTSTNNIGFYNTDNIETKNTNNYTYEPIRNEYCSFSSIVTQKNISAFISSSKDDVDKIIILNEKSQFIEIDKAGELPLKKEKISVAKSVFFKNRDNQKVQAFYYPPKTRKNIFSLIHNKEKNEKATLPPLIIKVHGGPTGQAYNKFNLKHQFWTSRGFAILDINYSGSTGFGSEYRNRLNGKWADLDVSECVDGAKWCVQNKLADKEKLIISGNSAGGLVALNSMAFYDTFSMACSVYGVADLIALATKTHKFEIDYFEKLIAPLNTKKDTYIKRSPIENVEKIKKPILFLQGDIDNVVLPEQSEKIFNKLISNNIDSSYILYKGEGHGFRKPQVIIDSLLSELYFYISMFIKNNNVETNKNKELLKELNTKIKINKKINKAY